MAHDRIAPSATAMRRLTAAVCVAVVAALAGCDRGGSPDSLFDSAGYHVRGDAVFYLQAFPGKAVEVGGADAATFDPLDRTFGKDRSTVYVDGRALADADPATFELLDRPDFAKDADHVYQRDTVFSDDPDHFELLDGNLARDSDAVYWSDGRILSDDPAHFRIVSDSDYYLFTRDDRVVQVNGNPVAGADPATFRVLRGGYSRDDHGVFYFTDRIAAADPRTFDVLEGPFARDARHGYWMGKPVPDADGATFHVLNAAFECSADDTHAYYRDDVIVDADPRSFPPGHVVTGCSETSVFVAP
ncbi:DKNYY domain-containing protein [Mycolicibacterium hodleri]|uniref:DKNYY domain-containing protein n=1 Tax=Mycolicibacterium hodleri TaxID=49897 RepID=UPI0021F28469|nr:DKNYY domain-containing protein [Mycolicibacterium hodleri]